MSEYLLGRAKTKIPADLVLDCEKRLVKLVVGKRWWWVDVKNKEPSIVAGLRDEEVYACVWKPFTSWADANRGVLTLFLDGKVTEQQLLERLKRVASTKDKVKPRDKKV